MLRRNLYFNAPRAKDVLNRTRGTIVTILRNTDIGVELMLRMKRTQAILIAAAVLTYFGMIEQCSATDLSGCWSGHWVSCTNGHKGPLHATFTRIDDTHYRANFRGRFWKFFPFRYSVTLQVIEEGDVVHLAGSSYLGRIMGTFHYQAEATSRDFSATYNSCKDNGKWVLSRDCSSCCK